MTSTAIDFPSVHRPSSATAASGHLPRLFAPMSGPAHHHASHLARFGPLLLDTARMAASVDGTPVRLSPLEYRLLNYLAHHSGRPVSAGEIADHLYGLAEQADVNAVEALVTRLRRKVGAGVIETRRGFGYLLAGGS